MAKRTTTTSRKPTAARSRKPTQRKRQQPPPFELSLRPEQQRDLFALFLIAIAAITIVLFLSDSVGVLGKRWVDLTNRLFGWGAVMVPLALGLLGIAIFWQERREDLPLTGSTVLGTLMVLMSLLVLLEFGAGERAADITLDKVDKGGGIVGFLLLTLFNQGFGRAAAFVGYCLLGLAGIVLTFNIGLKALIMGMRDSFARFLVTIWSASPTHERPDGQRRLLAAEPPREALPFVPPPGAEEDEIVPTPIAARPARASLFNRPETKLAAPAPRPPAEEKEQKSREGKQKDSRPGPNTVLTNLLAQPPGQGARLAEPPAEVVQEALDGFEIPATHHAWPLPSAVMLDAIHRGRHHRRGAAHQGPPDRGDPSQLQSRGARSRVNTGPAVTQFEPPAGVWRQGQQDHHAGERPGAGPGGPVDPDRGAYPRQGGRRHRDPQLRDLVGGHARCGRLRGFRERARPSSSSRSARMSPARP